MALVFLYFISFLIFGLGSAYPRVSCSWQKNWPNLITLFDYSAEIRKVIFTTNTIESLNSVIKNQLKLESYFQVMM
ncbi:MAG: hypothetical protein GY694_06205 [Gammaproteobacteria bacterium]|nr:hypothetical protein [Gammaproteobacteria bacterium]